jgi:hypothetical protein
MEVLNGGPAFPQVDLKDHYGMLVPDRQAGMTLRDYFAVNANIGDVDELTQQQGNAILGRRCPSYTDDLIGCMAWWADYRAVLRYIEADAMLRAREQK